MNPTRLIAGLTCLLIAWDGVSWAADTTELAAHRARLQMTEAPERAAHVVAVLQQLKSRPKQSGRAEMANVTVVGQIGGMPNPWADTHPDFPWFAGQGSFFLIDSKVAAQFATHAKHHGGDHNCAFCRSLAAKNAHAVAVVNLVDDAGKIIRIDSRELLGLQEGQTVTVHGRAELLGGTMLIVHAEGVYAGDSRVARNPAQ